MKIILLLCLFSCACSAQIASPVPNRVYQQVNGVGSFQAISRAPGGTWTLRKGSALIAQSLDGRFTNIPPGWYDLQLGTDSIKVGVGDVYLVAGQSNAVSPRQPIDYPVPKPAPGRVILSDYYNGSFGEVDPFIDAGVTTPTAGIAWLHAGIFLNRPYPVAFIIVAKGNTSSYDWAHVHITRIFRAWAIYSPRAILWHQGESDSTVPPRDDSFYNLNAIVSSVRSATVTPWVIALNSTSSPPPRGFYEWPVRESQRQVVEYWQDKPPKQFVFQGPDTDTVRTPGEVEFMGPDLQRHGELWASRLRELGL